MFGRPFADLEQVAPRWSTAVITQAVETGEIFELAACGGFQRVIQALGHVVSLAPIPTGRNPVTEDACAAITHPPERWFRQRDDVGLGAVECKKIDAARCEDFWQTRRVTKGIGLPSGGDRLAEARFEIALTVSILAHECLGTGEVGVGLDVCAAHDIPAPGFDHLFDAGKARGVVFLDMLIDRRLAADEGHFGKLVHQVEHGADGGEAFVEAFAPVPEPDRIKVGVADEVDGFIHGVLLVVQWVRLDGRDSGLSFLKEGHAGEVAAVGLEGSDVGFTPPPP